MKHTKHNSGDFEIPPFNFEDSIPNKYASHYSEDNQTIIIKSDNVKTIVLEPDVAGYFPDSQSVNFALRALIKAKPLKKYKKINS
ncbi:MAG: hypothetical protein HW421_2906 [Ignavibacteria bacterium]|nr:hypothetical protein [Ignavibacteria bacterium]